MGMGWEVGGGHRARGEGWPRGVLELLVWRWR